MTRKVVLILEVDDEIEQVVDYQVLQENYYLSFLHEKEDGGVSVDTISCYDTSLLNAGAVLRKTALDAIDKVDQLMKAYIGEGMVTMERDEISDFATQTRIKWAQS